MLSTSSIASFTFSLIPFLLSSKVANLTESSSFSIFSSISCLNFEYLNYTMFYYLVLRLAKHRKRTFRLLQIYNITFPLVCQQVFLIFFHQNWHHSSPDRSPKGMQIHNLHIFLCFLTFLLS